MLSCSSSQYHVLAHQERHTGDSFARVLLTVDCIQSEVSAFLLACLSHGGLAWDISAPELLRLQRLVLAQFRWCSPCLPVSNPFIPSAMADLSVLQFGTLTLCTVPAACPHLVCCNSEGSHRSCGCRQNVCRLDSWGQRGTDCAPAGAAEQTRSYDIQ